MELRQICKSFAGVPVLKNFSFDVAPGEIVGLIGENGAGKSTAVNLIYGLLEKDSGEVLWQDVPVESADPLAARTRGIGMVHQHFTLSPHHSVLENVLLALEEKPWVWIHRRRQIEYLESQRQELGFEKFSWDQSVSDLSVGEQQRLEIFKALLHRPALLILDEPTAVLTPQETNQFFESLKRFQALGTAIILISHKLKEILRITDRVFVLRQGEMVLSVATSKANFQDLASAMIGTKFSQDERPQPSVSEEVLLRISALRAQKSGKILDIQNLELHSGEILGIAGVEGNGQDLLIQALIAPSALPDLRGEVVFKNQNILSLSTSQILSMGFRALPEDRLKQGLMKEASAFENFLLGQSLPVWIDYRARKKIALERFKDYDVRPVSTELPLKQFSGGNQQKIVVARELLGQPKVLLASHPTRGVDLQAAKFIRKKIQSVTQNGGGVLLISSDLDEMFEMCHRILVIYRGKILETFAAPYSEEKLGAAMAGGGL